MDTHINTEVLILLVKMNNIKKAKEQIYLNYGSVAPVAIKKQNTKHVKTRKN